MAQPATLFIICSDMTRNGKTLLARVLADHLLIEGRDPFCFDLGSPQPALRGFFPGRTALAGLKDAQAEASFFERILSSAGRDQVIDIGASRLAAFRAAAKSHGLAAAARGRGFRLCILFIVDRDETSLKAAIELEEDLEPDLFVPVINRFAGSALPEGVPGPALAMERLDPELAAIIASRRFSLRAVMLGEEAGIPPRHQASLKNFLLALRTGIRDFAPALSLQQLRAIGQPPAKDL
ncbi:MAG: hypothetical protein ACKOED_06620 [Aestuariivirga sp.]|uniref:hypothetical protein n=1 Tax=Aestuariivirga sp. TaxID=2650926 RepID=UPI0038D173DD